jgi:hypothetical protein
MKKYLVSTLVLSLFVTIGFSQAAKSIYVELGGAGLASVNFDMRFNNKEDGLGFRAGIGGFSISTSDYIGGNGSSRSSVVTLPLGLTYLLGKDQKNYFELGAGITPVFASNSNTYDGSTSSDEFNSTFGHLYFGYRLQPAKGGFLFRAGITPVFGKGYFIPYYFGISFGYKF